MRVWRYVIAVDNGGAPNFEPPMTTLTVCKPRIRQQARRGDLVIAFNGAALNRDEPHSVRWAGVVSEVIPLADYWWDVRFRGKRPGQHGGERRGGRPDNIYCPTADGRLERVENETHEQGATGRDTGGVNALVLERPWRFGSAVAVLPARFGLRIVGGRRGHRRSEIDESTWRELEEWLDENNPGPGRQATAIDSEAPCTPSKAARTQPSIHDDPAKPVKLPARRRC